MTTTTTPSAPDKQQRALDRSLVGGVAWTGGIKWSSQLLKWASTLIIARLLVPEDYGLVGLATIFVGFVEMITEFGLGPSIVMLKGLDRETVSQINSLSVLLGITCFGLSCAFAIPISLFYRSPQLRWVIMSMSVAFVISSFKTVPYALLQKDMQFKFIAITEGINGLAQSLGMVVLALLGFRYWTLVFGFLIGSAVSTVLVCSKRFHHFGRPRYAILAKTLNFSRDVLVGKLCYFGYSNADFLTAGRVLGQSALGDYTLAWTLASIPVEKVSAMIGQVTPALFAAVQTDLAAMRRYVLSITGALALITFPLACGLGLVANDFVLLAMGEKWRGTILPLQILAAYGTYRSINPLISWVLLATGESRLVMWNAVLSAISMPVAFVIGSHWGTGGIAVAWVFVYPFITIIPYKRLFRRINLPPKDYIQSLWPAASGVLVMAASVLVFRYFFPANLPLGIRFALEVIVGAVGYSSVILLFHRDLLDKYREIISLARS